MTMDPKKNDVLENHRRFLGFEWIRGRYLLPQIERWGNRIEGTILDIGCGTKPYKAILGKNAQYIGIDASDPNADIQADALHLPFPENSIDTCFSSWMLDDIPEPGNYFKELHRVLKKGGIAIMVENQSFPEHDAPHDYFRFTQYGLAYLAEKNGFHVEEMIPLGGFWAQIGSQISSFFIRGVAGRIGGWFKISLIVINPLFYLMDRLNFLPRGTSAYFTIFRKIR